MVTITKQVFTNIFQTEYFLAVNFAIGYKKNMSYLVILKSPKVEKIGLDHHLKRNTGCKSVYTVGSPTLKVHINK